MVSYGFNLPRLKWIPPADDPDQQYDHGKNQQNMHVSANGIDAGDSEQPQNDEYYKNGPKHKFDLLVFKQVSEAAGIQPYGDQRFLLILIIGEGEEGRDFKPSQSIRREGKNRKHEIIAPRFPTESEKINS
ncbi:MAG: hypothetical protein WCD79_09580 [Chthoniobacteraceae bacterium]